MLTLNGQKTYRDDDQVVPLKNRIFYQVKPLIPRRVQIALRRMILHRKRFLYSHVWPIDEKSKQPPAGWRGWPDNKRFAFILTHDVESVKGQKKCLDLLTLEIDHGFRSSFNFVPKCYEVDPELRNHLVTHGFEVGVHGLYHDGKLYDSREIFRKNAIAINHYLEEWGAVGFRSPSMHHNLEWLLDLNVKYDASTFDTDPFEPQADGVGTIFPFYVKGHDSRQGYVELPYTLPQDFTLFILMNEKNIDIWKKKLDWIVAHGGMALLNTHPDYMNFRDGKLGREEFPVHLYEQFLKYVTTAYADLYWNVLPKQVAGFFYDNHAKNKIPR